jgi:exodeoxyribonuclease V alpha subunit
MYGESAFLNMREGDSVLFTKNLYHLDIQNGSLGILSSVEGGQFETVEGLEEKYYGEVILDTGEEIKITEEVLNCMVLG